MTGTLSTTKPTLTFTGSLTGSDPGAYTCLAPTNNQNPAPSCDEYTLTVSVPSNFAVTDPRAKIRVSVTMDDTEDYDLYVYDKDFNDVADSASADNPEVAEFTPASGDFLIDVTAIVGTGGHYTATITLVRPDNAPADADGDGVSDGSDLCPGTPPGTTVDANGCPAVTLPTDSDQDGVSDSSDACPGTPAGTAVDATGCPVATVPELPLHFHGNQHEACSGVGQSDFVTCSGPFLKESGTLDPSAPAAHFDYNELGGTNGQGPYDANWTWKPTSAVTVKGYTVVNFWASCNATCIVSGGSWDVSVYKNNTTQVATFEILEATPTTPDVPSRLSVHFTLPSEIKLNGTTDTLTLKLEAHYSDTGAASRIYYDSVSACPGASGAEACDSIVIFNAKAPPPPPPPPPPEKAAGLPPRYQIHVSPPDLGNEAGEPSVGFDPLTFRTMFISYTQALRETYPELDLVRKDAAGEQLPQSCDALWEDKSGTLTTVNSLDPILFTDQATGRTFNSQLSGDNSLMEYTDDDGDNWTPAQAGPPNGGADHQAVATGIYPAGAEPPNASWPATGPKRAVYYCSQSVATAFCSRSDDGGTTFGPGFPFKNTDCAAGALHGHVKVAPDGTVYVPDSSQCVAPVGGSAEHVIAFVSEDAGHTWNVRPVEQSTGGDGSDPSIGIATDGTLYMCYPNADSTVHVAVSTDKGVTWTGGQDVGLAEGLVQTRFPQMIAGDPDRASCAFLGTKTAGNGNSLDFEGVWYGYQATTYDKGKTWHLVNVTPDDPVQGYGGVGPDGTNRNLLDFNDLQIDEQGRTLFAFADGCIGGCVKDPSANSFAAKATIVRQVGGRTLFAKYDDASQLATANPRYNTRNPVKPTPACARQDQSTRSQVQADIVWNAPDDGGSPITDYKVYRSTAAAGPFTLVGDAGTERHFIDTTTKPSIEKYYYRVEATNALGTAALGNTVELPIGALADDPCKLPGEIISLDAEGDVSPAGPDDLDIRYLAVAETADFADAFVVTMKMANFTTGDPPQSSFYVILFPNYGNLYIALDSANGPTSFVHGTYQEDPAGQGFLVYTPDGALDARSEYLADGTIRFVVPRSLFGNPAVGATIPGFDARVRVGASSANSRDTAGNVDYVVKGISECTSPGFVIADLTASKTAGPAPLAVDFSITGGQSKGKKLSTYSILFGDEPGADPTPTTGSFANQPSVSLSHVYAAPGTYRARLKVTDEAGGTSTNAAEETITVVPGADPTGGGGGPAGGGPVTASLGNTKVGGGLAPLSLGLLSLGALARRRRKSGR